MSGQPRPAVAERFFGFGDRVGAATLRSFVVRAVLNPLGFTRTIKAKFAVVILAAIATAVVTSQVGYFLGWPIWLRPTVAAVVSVITVPFIARGMTQPLRDMAGAARRMAGGDYAQRVETTSIDEVGQLAVAFNTMSAAVAQADRTQRDLIGNVSHELRTPIAGLRATLENLSDGVAAPTPEVFEAMMGRVARLERLIADLLDLSRLEAGIVPMAQDVVDIAELVAEVAEGFLDVDEPILLLNLAPGLTVRGDAERLYQVLTNLIENALRHGYGPVEINASRNASDVSIEVADQGPGITDHPDRLFERFYRAPEARTGDGVGLGLAIVRWIVDLHGGHVSAGPNHPTGARFTVTLPAA